jgi:hypothetical protein
VLSHFPVAEQVDEGTGARAKWESAALGSELARVALGATDRDLIVTRQARRPAALVLATGLPGFGRPSSVAETN